MTQNEEIVKNELLSQGFTKEAVAAVLGICGGESNFTQLKELSYANTSNTRIRAIFPVKLGKMSDGELNVLKRDYNAFFSKVYGNMYGSSENGVLYTGRGFHGLTFLSNYKLASDATGIDFINNPELLENPIYASKEVAWYFGKIKDYTDLEIAFREAYRMNAGVGKSFEYYAASTNPVHVQGIVRKRAKANYYYKLF